MSTLKPRSLSSSTSQSSLNTYGYDRRPSGQRAGDTRLSTERHYTQHHSHSHSTLSVSDYPPILRSTKSWHPAKLQSPAPSKLTLVSLLLSRTFWRRVLPFPLSFQCSTSLIVIGVFCTVVTTTTLSVILALIAAPILTSCMMTCLGLSVMFILTESQSLGIWHHNRESENRFWILVTTIFTSALLFSSDSPLNLGRSHPMIGLLLVLGAALYVNHYDRQLSRVSLNRTPHLRRVSSLLLVNQESARSKLKQVNDSLAALDFKFVLLKGIKNSEIFTHELSIVNIFEEANEDELNYLVTNVNLSLLFYKLKDRDVLTWHRSNDKHQHRTRILLCLCQQRLLLLHTAARVNIIDALMNLRLKAHLQAEQWIANIIINTHGRGLTRLKTACDAKGTITNLHKLIFRDIHSPSIQQSILAHIQHEASLLLTDPRNTSGTRRKILSDVDDTLFSSGAKFPAGIDLSFPPRTVYPGVLTFYKELDLGFQAQSTGDWHDGRLGNLVFLSARPHVYKDKAESRSYLHFEQLRVQKGIGLHCVPTLLAGSLDSGWRMLFRGDFAALAATKYENFVEFAQLYPEFTFVFVGDNGQGDVMAAQRIKEKLGDRLEGVYIHLVQPLHRTPGYALLTPQQRAVWQSFHFFYTYASAALHATQRRLIDYNALIRVSSHAITRLIELKDTLTITDWEARREELNRDIETVNHYLRSLDEFWNASKKDFLLPLIPSDNHYPINSRVLTMFGMGVIRDYEPINSVYIIELFDWRLANNQPVYSYQHKSEIELMQVGSVGSRVYIVSLGLTGVIEAIRTRDSIYQIAILEWRLRHGSSVRCYLPATDCIEIVAGVGELVHCDPFGFGIVKKYRHDDGVYEIALRLSGESSLTNSASHNFSHNGGSERKLRRAKPATSGVNVRDARSLSRMCNSTLYTVGVGMRRVDEEETKKPSCAVM